MASKNTHGPKMPGETYDMNGVRVAGAIQKLWPRGGDVYARLCLSSGDCREEAVFASVRFPGGKIKEQPVSLLPGDLIGVSGYLTHNEYFETIQRFLLSAGEADFLGTVPPEDSSAWQAITFRRVNLILNACGLESFDQGRKDIPAGQFRGDSEVLPTCNARNPNVVMLEGIVARKWEYAQHLFIRLAVYDRFTPFERGEPAGKHGRVRRKPHYITVRFFEKKVAGRNVTVELKDHLRLTGSLGSQTVSVTLHQALLETGRPEVIDLLTRLPNADKLQEISARQDSLHVEAASLIVYTARSSI